MKKRSSSQKSQKPTVKSQGTQKRVTIGMDLGDETSRWFEHPIDRLFEPNWLS